MTFDTESGALKPCDYVIYFYGLLLRPALQGGLLSNDSEVGQIIGSLAVAGQITGVPIQML